MESCRTTIIGILVLAGRRLSATQLIRLAAPLGLSATNVKSHLSRMVKDGALDRKGPARLATYAPSAAQLLVIEGIQARLAKTRKEPWDGAWMMLAVRRPAQRLDKERLRASLWFDGWRPVGPDAFVRPAWPRAWAQDSALQHAEIALGFYVCGQLIAAPAEKDTLYDLKGLDAEAHRLAAWISHRSVSARSPQAAFVERMNVGGRVARMVGHDPRLPPAIWGKRRGMEEMIDAFQRFEARIAPRARQFLDEKVDGRPAVKSKV